ncbi:MAG: thioredoxin family protein [Lactobacillaceae bacterium]|jgi:suppressor for copper-sensitivity B|nr:thioredoxin family protein [Lactobacillaceae bacterium]
MSRFLKYIIIFFLILSTASAFAAEKNENDEKTTSSENGYVENQGGLVVLDLDESPDEPKQTAEEKIKILVDTVKHLDKVLEGDKLDKNFTGELAKVFPEDTAKDLYDKQRTVRIGMRLYRYFLGVYNDVKAKMLVPEEPPLIVDEEDYDTGYDGEYIKAPDGYAAVVQDFKKVLAYGSNPRDVASMTAKRKRDLENKKEKNKMEELWVTLSKVDWKNTIFGTIPIDSPFTANLGAGNWDEKDNIRIRVLADTSKTNNGSENIKMVFSIRVDDGYFIKASALDDNPYIKIDFSGSQNIKSYEVFYPAQKKVELGGEDAVSAYGGLFAIPFVVELEDENKDLALNASVSVVLCDLKYECKNINLNPELVLEHGEGLPSQYEQYISLNHTNIPKSENEDLKILSVIGTELNNGEKILRVVFENHHNLSSLDVFIESPEGIELARPRIAIDGAKITARAELKDQSIDIIGRKFLITAVVNKLYTLRKLETATDSSIFDMVNEKISIALILLAVLGGFLLNFMPCVFPVLSIKLLSLNKVGARKFNEVRKSFYLTIAGILITFFILALILCLIKYLGYSIGWGMQFQNPVFLICMMFLICMFIGVIFEFQKIATPAWLNKFLFKSKDENSIIYFMTGVLVVIMATPCTAPYLGTTIGFALAGSYYDITAILMSVAVGLSIPYIFFAAFPFLAVYVPKPGDWMNKLNNFMALMLVLTLIWLISIFYAQTNGWTAFRMVVYLLLFLFVLWFRNILNSEIDAMIETKEERQKLKRKYKIIALTITLSLFAVALYDSAYNFIRKKQEIMEVRENKIDMNLINSYVNEGKVVLVNVQADWCLTCMYNEMAVFSNVFVERLAGLDNVVFINVDWTTYDKDVLAFMEKFGRKGLPFYVVFSKNIPDGMVLPEILNEIEFTKMINSAAN